MKTLKFIMVAACLAIAACRGTDSSVSGIYVESFKNEYSIATDTLIINAYNLSGGIYQIERRSGFHRIIEGKVQTKEYKHEKWMATFDKNKQVLQETAYGRQVYIKPDGHSLSYDGIYQKIK